MVRNPKPLPPECKMIEEMNVEPPPPLVCRHCGKCPSEHNLSARDRLVCRDKSGNEYKYTDKRRAWDLDRMLERAEQTVARLRKERAALAEAAAAERRELRFHPAIEDFLDSVLPTMEGYDECGELINPESE